MDLWADHKPKTLLNHQFLTSKIHHQSDLVKLLLIETYMQTGWGLFLMVTLSVLWQDTDVGAPSSVCSRPNNSFFKWLKFKYDLQWSFAFATFNATTMHPLCTAAVHFWTLHKKEELNVEQNYRSEQWIRRKCADWQVKQVQLRTTHL